MDRNDVVRVRLEFLGHRSLRAAAGRNLQPVSILSLGDGGTALYAAAGSHADSSGPAQSAFAVGDKAPWVRVIGGHDSPPDAPRPLGRRREPARIRGTVESTV